MFSRRLASNAIRASGRHGQSFTSSLRPQNQNIPSRLPQPQRLFSPSLLRCLSTEVRGAIDRAVGSAPVVLFMKGTPETPQCGFSRASVQILGLQGVDPTKFVAFNVLEDQALREGIKKYSEWPTIPQLYVKGEFVGGCDILVNMHQSGELAKLFEKSDVLVTEAEATDATVGETSSAETKA